MPLRAVPGRLIIFGFVTFVVWQWWSAPVWAFFGRRSGPHDALDFSVFYAAGDLVASGQGGRLYDTDALTAVQHASIPLPMETTLAYLNPPFFAALIAPLALLPFDTAFQVWTLINVALLAIACVLLWKCVHGLPVVARLTLVAGFAVLPQTAYALLLGQFSIVLLLSWVAAYAFLRNGNDRAAGVALAPLLIKPELLIPVVIFLLWKRRTAVLSTLLPITAVAVIASLAIVGLGGLIDYPAHIIDTASTHTAATNSTAKMSGWTGIMAASIGSEHAGLQALIAIPLAVATIAAVALTWRGPLDVRGERFPVQWLALTLGTLLADPHLYLQDTLLVYPAVAVGVASVPAARGWLVPILAATWLIGSMGQSPNVNDGIALFGVFMVAALAMTVVSGSADRAGAPVRRGGLIKVAA